MQGHLIVKQVTETCSSFYYEYTLIVASEME